MTPIITSVIAAAVPLLQPAIKWAVQGVEHVFSDPGTGAAKFASVEAFVSKIADQLSTAGKIPGQLDPASIASMIETVVQSLKADGALSPAATTTKPATTTPAISAQIVKVAGTLTIGG